MAEDASHQLMYCTNFLLNNYSDLSAHLVNGYATCPRHQPYDNKEIYVALAADVHGELHIYLLLHPCKQA